MDKRNIRVTIVEVNDNQLNGRNTHSVMVRSEELMNGIAIIDHGICEMFEDDTLTLDYINSNNVKLTKI